MILPRPSINRESCTQSTLQLQDERDRSRYNATNNHAPQNGKPLHQSPCGSAAEQGILEGSAGAGGHGVQERFRLRFFEAGSAERSDRSVSMAASTCGPSTATGCGEGCGHHRPTSSAVAAMSGAKEVAVAAGSSSRAGFCTTLQQAAELKPDFCGRFTQMSMVHIYGLV